MGTPSPEASELQPSRQLADAWDRRAGAQLALTAVLLGTVLAGFAWLVEVLEQRPGAALPDPLLALFDPRDLTWLTFGLVYGGLLLALFSLLGRPQRLLLTAQAYALMVAMRGATIWLTPLEPPAQLLVLKDPFIGFFGPSDALTKDLFFSGHTATLFLLFLTASDRRLRGLFLAGTAAVGACVLWQHVHYTVDVFAAPVFAYAAVRLTVATRRRLGLPDPVDQAST